MVRQTRHPPWNIKIFEFNLISFWFRKLEQSVQKKVKVFFFVFFYKTDPIFNRYLLLLLKWATLEVGGEFTDSVWEWFFCRTWRKSCRGLGWRLTSPSPSLPPSVSLPPSLSLPSLLTPHSSALSFSGAPCLHQLFRQLPLPRTLVYPGSLPVKSM